MPEEPDFTGVRPGPGAITLTAGDARAVVRPAEGGRLGSLEIAGRELLVTADPFGPIQWGAYPMAPYAGRVAYGTFTFAGRRHELPLAMPPHAIHGVVFDRSWRVAEATSRAATVEIELDERWPFRGRVEQSFALREDGLDVTLALHADEPMPATIGWHPWFRRSIDGDGRPAVLRFEATTMLVRGADGIPTGERVPPTAGSWDDAFTGLRADPVIEWPGLTLTLSSTCAWWVVYTEPANALCVEPQSGPPDALNRAPEIVEPGAPLVHTMRWRWDLA